MIEVSSQVETKLPEEIGAEARLLIDAFIDRALAGIPRWTAYAPFSPEIALALMPPRDVLFERIVEARNAPGVLDLAVRAAIGEAIQHAAGPLN